jgi:hypothetical protein
LPPAPRQGCQLPAPHFSRTKPLLKTPKTPSAWLALALTEPAINSQSALATEAHETTKPNNPMSDPFIGGEI